MRDTVKLGIASHLNVSFRHKLDTNMTPEEWGELTEIEQDQLILEIVWECIDVWVEDQ